MKKIVFDADAIIKLVKAGIVHHIRYQSIISEEVYRETVVEGKKRLYADAFALEQLIKEKKIIVKKARKVLLIEGLGSGESSSLALFIQEKADSIVSDDKRFLRLLEEQNISFIISVDVIVSMALAKQLSKPEARMALMKIKEFVKKENYENAMNALE